ncbi:MAG: hypothetical protein AAF708_00105 [Deinococcota bacterium]
MAVSRKSRPAGGFVWVLGSRSCSESFRLAVHRVVSRCVADGLGIAAGGAVGPDSWALESLLACLPSAPAAVRHSSLVVLAWQLVAGCPVAARPSVSAAVSAGVPVRFGSALPGCTRQQAAGALFGRSRLIGTSGRLTAAVAFVGDSVGRGTFFSLGLCARRVPVFVFASSLSVLPSLGQGCWHAAKLAGFHCYRWSPASCPLFRGGEQS